MRATEFLNEGLRYPVIVVDVQPAYASFAPKICEQIVKFVVAQTGPVLMFVNADRDGLTDDTIPSIKEYWDETSGGEYDEETGEFMSNIDWNRFSIADKGYGYFRSYMDQGVSESTIIKLIRIMYQRRVTDARELPNEEFQQLMGAEYRDWMDDESFSINWTSVSQIKQFNGAYIVGGGRNECLREVELLMNAFNIRYKRIDKLVY